MFAIFGLLVLVNRLQEIQAEKIALGVSEDVERIDELLVYMGGLDRLMFTLVQVLTGDSFHSIMREILLYISWSWVYFYAYISVGTIVLMNLVTAIIVDNAMEKSRKDRDHAIREKEAEQQQDIKHFGELFQAMDTDDSGSLSWEEFQASFSDPQMRRNWMLLDFQPSDCKELFNLLDDGEGQIEIEEFMEALSQMKGVAMAKDVYRLQKLVTNWRIQCGWVPSPKATGQRVKTW